MSSINYTLYYGMYSLCSMMVRYTMRVRGIQKDNLPSALTEIHIDIPAKQNITEEYLLTVNRKGQVPALTSSTLDQPMADSLLITEYLMEEFPNLAPEAYREKIERSLKELHALNYYSLSYSGTNRFTQWLQGGLEDILKGEISREYRAAIEYKLGVIEHEYVQGLETSTVDDMVERARSFLLDMSALLPEGSKWLFGVEEPTALDAHLVPFLVRLKDVKREELIPENLRAYVEEAEKTSEWRDVMQGRSTYSPATNVPATGRTK